MQKSLKIGFTYDLKDEYLAQGFTAEEAGEFDPPETIDAIENALVANGYEVERIGNIKSLVNALAAGKRWDLVFNIAEGVTGLAREAQIPSLLEAYNIPYTFSPADVMVKTLDKSLAKHIVRSHGLNTADFFVVSKPEDISKVNLPYPLFVKPIGEGSSKGIHDSSYVQNSKQFENICRKMLLQFSQPVLVETYLPGREFTVALFGSGESAKILGVIEIIMSASGDKYCYSMRNKTESHVKFDYPEDSFSKAAGELALKAWQALEGQNAGRIDIRFDNNNEPCFIEANPLSELHADGEFVDLFRHAGFDYNTMIKVIVEDNFKKIKHYE